MLLENLKQKKNCYFLNILVSRFLKFSFNQKCKNVLFETSIDIHEQVVTCFLF